MPKKQKTSSNLLEVQNAAKTMFANIRFQSIDDPIRSILLTSSVPDEGKTTTAWYLAQAAATAGNMVLLVEADMRRRSLANMLQLHPRNGLFSVLTANAQLEDAIVGTSVNNLFFLDAEPSIPNPPDVLASKRMRRLNETLREEFDYVIYDTPPVGTFVDAAVLSTVVDGVVLVVRPGRAKRTELQIAHSQLANADANIIGLCTTFVEGTGSEYYYSYYTKGGRSRRNDGKDIDLVVDASATAAHGSGGAGEPYEPSSAPVRQRPASQDNDFSESENLRSEGERESVPVSEGAARRSSDRTSQAPTPNQNRQGYPNLDLPRTKPANNRGGISVPRGNPRGYAGKSGVIHTTPPDRTIQIPRQ